MNVYAELFIDVVAGNSLFPILRIQATQVILYLLLTISCICS